MSACVQGCSCRLCNNSIPFKVYNEKFRGATYITVYITSLRAFFNWETENIIYTSRSAGRNKLCRMTCVYGSLISPCRMTCVYGSLISPCMYMVVLLARLPNQGIDHQKLVLEHWEARGAPPSQYSTLPSLPHLPHLFFPCSPSPSPPSIFLFLPYSPSIPSIPNLPSYPLPPIRAGATGQVS